MAIPPGAEDAVVESVRRGVPLTSAAQAAGTSLATVSRWLQIAADPDLTHPTGEPITPELRERAKRFAEKLARARAECQQVLVNSMYTAATEPQPKTGVPDWRAADVILSKHPSYRKDWHEHREVEVQHSGTVEHEHKLVQELAAIGGMEALDTLEVELLALPDGHVQEGPG